MKRYHSLRFSRCAHAGIRVNTVSVAMLKILLALSLFALSVPMIFAVNLADATRQTAGVRDCGVSPTKAECKALYDQSTNQNKEWYDDSQSSAEAASGCVWAGNTASNSWPVWNAQTPDGNALPETPCSSYGPCLCLPSVSTPFPAGPPPASPTRSMNIADATQQTSGVRNCAESPTEAECKSLYYQSFDPPWVSRQRGTMHGFEAPYSEDNPFGCIWLQYAEHAGAPNYQSADLWYPVWNSQTTHANNPCLDKARCVCAVLLPPPSSPPSPLSPPPSPPPTLAPPPAAPRSGHSASFEVPHRQLAHGHHGRQKGDAQDGDGDSAESELEGGPVH